MTKELEVNQTVGDIVQKIVGGYDWDRLSSDAKRQKYMILSDWIDKANENNDKIVDFLNEVEEQDWELDSDDIKHIINLDFDYIRKQYQEVSQ